MIYCRCYYYYHRSPATAYTSTCKRANPRCAKNEHIRQFPFLSSQYYSYLQYYWHSQYYSHSQCYSHLGSYSHWQCYSHTRVHYLINAFSTCACSMHVKYDSDSGALAKLLASAPESLALDCKVASERHCISRLAEIIRGIIKE